MSDILRELVERAIEWEVHTMRNEVVGRIARNDSDLYEWLYYTTDKKGVEKNLLAARLALQKEHDECAPV